MAKNAIHHLRNYDGNKISDPAQIKVMVENYYKDLLGCANTDVIPYFIDHIKSIHDFRYTSDSAPRLSDLPTNSEVKDALFALPKNKAPGPDVFSAEFFVTSLELVGPVFTVVVLEFFSASKLPHQINATTIAIFPKLLGAKKLFDYRPISCCNTVYKVVSRILSGRLNWFVDEAVQNNHVGFVSEKLLSENVLLVSELVSDFHKPTVTSRGCVQIDLTKEYGNMDWMFLMNILAVFELPERFKGWINQCITTTSFSVSLNGELVGFFPGKKGLRQGDPISSSLFVLAMDILAKDLDNRVRTNQFGHHPQCIDPLVTHLGFADDVLIFFDGTERSLAGIIEDLNSFYVASGLQLNLGKSRLFLDGNNSPLC